MWEVIAMNKFSRYNPLFLFLSIVVSLFLIFLPILVGVLSSYSEKVDNWVVMHEPMFSLFIIVSMIGAFFGGALFIIAVRRISVYRAIILNDDFKN